MMDVINVYFYFFIVTSSNMYRELILKVFFVIMSSRLYKFVTFLSTSFLHLTSNKAFQGFMLEYGTYLLLLFTCNFVSCFGSASEGSFAVLIILMMDHPGQVNRKLEYLQGPMGVPLFFVPICEKRRSLINQRSRMT